MPSSIGEIAGLHDPAAWKRTLPFRNRAELPFDASAVSGDAALMPDTTVYVDARTSTGLPLTIEKLVRQRRLLHAAVACAELAISIGHLDPAHPDTERNRRALVEILTRIDLDQVVAPSASAWAEAATIAGILARIQGYQRETRRELLLDALVFLTARETGAVLMSRNIRHMDLLLRFRPDTRVLLYDRA